MDADRLGRGEQIAGICAVILFIFMFFNWFSLPDEVNGVPTGVGLAEAAGIDTSINAWQAYDFTDLILLVTIVVAAGGAVATLMARDVALPVAASAITAGLGILSFVFVAFSILNTPSEGPIDLDRSWGVFVGLVLTAGIAYGGWMSMQEEGTSFGDQVDRVQGGGGAPPPPPPPAAPPPGGPPAGGPPAQ
jgi:hypothetical protein